MVHQSAFERCCNNTSADGLSEQKVVTWFSSNIPKYLISIWNQMIDKKGIDHEEATYFSGVYCSRHSHTELGLIIIDGMAAYDAYPRLFGFGLCSS